MEWHINDLSIAGQYETPAAFRSALEPLLCLRRVNPSLATHLYCSRGLSQRPATPFQSVKDAVLALRDRTYTTLVLSWLNKSGPFWDDTRQVDPHDYFFFEGDNVTEQGLGEAARRIVSGRAAGVFSFVAAISRFSVTPLLVGHGIEEEPQPPVSVSNWWRLADLQEAAVPRPASWAEMVAIARGRFPMLRLPPAIHPDLEKMPFYGGVVELIFERLRVLQTLAEETGSDGQLGAEGLRLLQDHFVGEKAQFSSEDPRCEADLAFKDPEDSSRQIFCPWHGKVKLSQIRVHFEWPRPRGQVYIKVGYIGPKITKW